MDVVIKSFVLREGSCWQWFNGVSSKLVNLLSTMIKLLIVRVIYTIGIAEFQLILWSICKWSY